MAEKKASSKLENPHSGAVSGGGAGEAVSRGRVAASPNLIVLGDKTYPVRDNNGDEWALFANDAGRPSLRKVN
jgi:hypothetical protein